MQTSKITQIFKYAIIHQSKPKSQFPVPMLLSTSSSFFHGNHKPFNDPTDLQEKTFQEETILFNDPSMRMSQVNSGKLSGPEIVEKAIQEAAPKVQAMIAGLSDLERDCLKKFVIGAMSHGAINYQAHAMLAAGANLCGFFLTAKENPELIPSDTKNYQEAFKKLIQQVDPVNYGPKSNSGEGGELAIRDNSLSQSFIRQVASGRFGVNLRYLAYARELQIKINQGAKPGVGGQLPGHKVTEEIAKARYAIPGLSLISPPPHHDIYSIEDLRQLVYDLRSVNPKAKISIKIASLAGCGTIAVGMAKCFPQKFKSDKLDISIAGPGGTGAATLTDKHEINQPWETALAEIHQALMSEGLRERVTLTVSGGIQTGLDSFKAILLGADNIETGSGALVSLGCIMVRKCHEGDCPTGIATNKQDLIDLKFKGKPEHVAKYLIGLATSLSNQLKKYGFKTPNEAVGRTDLLEVDNGSPLSGLERLLIKQRFNLPPEAKEHYHPEHEAGSSQLEYQIIEGIKKGQKYFKPQANSDILSFGARIGYYQQINNLLKEPITVDFKGLSNGQSFGFSAPHGLTLIAENANDGTGKALSGAEIYIKGLAGNCLGYGALEGFIAAKECGDRAGIRLSYKARIVVKKLGNNAFNFMTGGCGLILGDERFYEDLKEKFIPKKGNFFREEHMVGPNLGSGFTGGVLIIPRLLDEELKKKGFINKSMLAIKFSDLDYDDIEGVKEDLQKFNKHIPADSLVMELLSKTNEELSKYFIKYQPKAVSAANTKPKDDAKNLKNSLKVAPKILQFEPQPENTQKTPIESKGCSTTSALEKALMKLDQPKPLTQNKTPIQIPEAVNTSHEFDSCGVAMLAQLNRVPSHDLVEKALQMIGKFQHRGSIGIDPNTGDGCGIMWFGFQSFFRNKLPHVKQIQKNPFGVIFLAFPEEYGFNEVKERFFYKVVQTEGLEVVGVRKVPVNNEYLGFMARQQTYYYKQFLAINTEKPGDVDDLELKLMRVRLRFEFELQNEKNKLIPHIFSASSQYVIYKGLFREKYFKDYFIDMQDYYFEASLAISHVRFATNTLPQFKNIQPLARLANNGENNNLALIERFISEDPFLKETLHLSPDLWTMSDSHILSLFLDYYFLKLYDKKSDDRAFKILRSVMHPYYPSELQSSTISHYYNLFGLPFEGPNASVAFLDQKVALYRDRNGFRPLRGLINKDMVYVGSELGPIEMEGEAFNLPPAEPVFFDVSNPEKPFGFYSESSQEIKNIMKQWDTLSKPPRDIKFLCEIGSNSIKKMLAGDFSSSELKLMKLRANWTEELDELIMQRIFRGEELMSSMADQGPIEALVFGSFLDVNGMFKAKFSQVTNPPLAKKEEECFMSLLTFIGKKPSFEALALDSTGSNPPQGLILSSPIITTHELVNILLDPRIVAAELPMTYQIDGFEDAIKIQLNLLAQSAVSLVREKKVNVIHLTDLSVDDSSSNQGIISPILVASVIDRALMAAGLRRDVSLILSASSLLIGRDMAQAISIGGVDAVHPYLPLIQNPSDKRVSKEEHQKRCRNYKEKMQQELHGFMARMGISSISAYRGAKVFQAFGLDPDLAALYGVRSEFGGFGLRELAQLIYSNHSAPKGKGYGKYDGVSREFIWKAETAQLAIKATRSQNTNEQRDFFNRYEKEADLLKRGNPRGWLKLVKPSIWSEHNPLTVCVLGGGAAGFYQAEALIDSKLPVKLTILESKHVNLFGLVGEGVAPDHSSTKKQGYILQKCLEDDRVDYYGGVDVGTDITVETLRSKFACIIDCRGAHEDVKLGITGESLSQVLPASKVYRAYNGVFDPKRSEEWPFNTRSRNPAIGIIGSGNVSADLARILLAEANTLEETTINPNFLRHLRDQGPQIVYLIARGGPHDSKISIKELEEIATAGFWISSWFDLSLIPPRLDEKQKDLLSFYTRYLNNSKPNNGLKRLYFIFQHTPVSFQACGEDVELRFSNQSHKYRFRNVITALGRKPSAIIGKGTDYVSGWAAGRGGNLKSAEASAKFTMEAFVKDFRENRFKAGYDAQSPENETWHLKCPVNKQEFLNILTNVQEKNVVIRNAQDFQGAKASSSNAVGDTAAKKRKVLDPEMFKDLKQDPENLTIFNGENVFKVPVMKDVSLLKTLKSLQMEKKEFKEATPEYECDGEGTCGTCGFDVVIGGEGLKQSKKEKQLLEINGFSEKSVLSCQHDCEKMKGYVLYVDKKKGQKKEEVLDEAKA